MYEKKDPFVRVFSYSFFRAGKTSVAFINRGQFLQTVLNTAQKGSVASLDKRTSSVLEAHIFFHNTVVSRE